MADYVPVFKPGQAVTMTAGAAITGGQLVYVSAANTVQKTSAATAAWLGVAMQDTDSGDQVAVSCGGVQELTASAAISVGAAVIPAADGKVATIGSETNYARVIGIALTAASADGDEIRVAMFR